MCDKQLITAILKGDEQAFKRLVDTYAPMIVNTCYAFVHNKEEAEDIAQEVFIQAFESLSQFRGDCKISTWLYKIAVNKSLNVCNSFRKKAIQLNLENWGKNSNPQSNELLPDEIMEKQEQINLLHAAIDRLPKNQRTALILNKYEDLSYKEVAEIMGVSLSSIESLLFRAKSNLEKLLNKKK